MKLTSRTWEGVLGRIIVPIFFLGVAAWAVSGQPQPGQQSDTAAAVEIGLCSWTTTLPPEFRELQRGSGWLMADEKGRGQLIMACLPNAKRTSSIDDIEPRIRERGGEVRAWTRRAILGGLDAAVYEHGRVDRGRRIDSAEAYVASKAYEYRIYVVLRNVPQGRSEKEARMRLARAQVEAILSASEFENGRAQSAVPEAVYRSRLMIALLVVSALGLGAALFLALRLRKRRSARRVRGTVNSDVTRESPPAGNDPG